MSKVFGTIIDNNATCDICGSKDNLTRHHIIPQQILRVIYTNSSIRSKTAKFPIAILCQDCHTKIENRYRGDQMAYNMREMAWYLTSNMHSRAKRDELAPMLNIFKFQMNIYNVIFNEGKKNILNKMNALQEAV